MTQTAKRAFFLSVCDKPRLFWNKLKECTGLGKLRKSSLLWSSSTPIISKASANVINRSFLDKITSIKEVSKSTNISQCASTSSPNVNLATTNFEIKPILSTEVRKLLADLPQTGSAGADAQSAAVLKFIPNELSVRLAKLFNMSIKFGLFPVQWKAVVMTPVYKKGNKVDVSHYR